MEDSYWYISEDRMPPEDLHWFYAKSKVPICLAITECFPLLEKLTEAGILSEEEMLKLQADPRSVHRVIYECLCWIEEKDLSLSYFFNNLFQKPLLKLFPDLKPVFREYKDGNYKNITQTTSDKDKDQMIFAQEKVKICLAIREIFPFIHGLQDLTILSEVESLKLQADGRPVSQVIYDCLTLIEKKDLKLSIVFEYIFQQCYHSLYPDLKVILQEPSVEQAGPFNGKHHIVFTRKDGLLEFYKQNKADVAAAVNERFPFLNGLLDAGQLSKYELLKLQADKRPTKEVLYDALSCIQERGSIKPFFSYLFLEFNVRRFPKLKIILHKLNRVLLLDMCHPISDKMESMMQETRKCRLQPISYTELSDNDWELIEDKDDKKGVKSSCLKRKSHNGIQVPSPKNGQWDQKWIRDAMNVKVRLEFPKQLFNDKFYVSCGYMKGLFIRKCWKGDTRNDMCIKCNRRMFNVIQFEKYGGRMASKNWKKSIRCAGIIIEKLFLAGVLKSPNNIRKSL